MRACAARTMTATRSRQLPSPPEPRRCSSITTCVRRRRRSHPAHRRRHSAGARPVAAAVNGDPSTALRVVGITGTNGKTTTSMLVAAILRAAGDPTGVIGTLSGAYTTPEAPHLQARLAEFRDRGDRSVVMEVSSHALALHRVDGTRFDAAVFTNLGRDHLDLHGTVEEYFRAKALLFQPGRAVVGVVNVDDAHGRLLVDAAPIEMVPFSIDDASDVEVTASSFAFTWRGERVVGSARRRVQRDERHRRGDDRRGDRDRHRGDRRRPRSGRRRSRPLRAGRRSTLTRRCRSTSSSTSPIRLTASKR